MSEATSTYGPARTITDLVLVYEQESVPEPLRPEFERLALEGLGRQFPHAHIALSAGETTGGNFRTVSARARRGDGPEYDVKVGFWAGNACIILVLGDVRAALGCPSVERA